MRPRGQNTIENTVQKPTLRPGEQPLNLSPRGEHRSVPREKKPEWLKIRLDHGEHYLELKGIMRGLDLHTVCEEAHCPNIYECWNQRTATFMILGDTCTRACRFCGIKWGRPTHLDREEPKRVAAAVQAMGLRHAVVTSVNRDELDDGGAGIFAETIREIHAVLPDCGVEVLIPDFQGNWDALRTVIEAGPDILNHNIETVPRLFRRIQPWDSYEVSLELLRRSKEMAPTILTKSGIMVGLGEQHDELVAVMRDLVGVDLDILTIGQYLPPSQRHAPLDRYYRPEEFAQLKAEGEGLGIRHVESGPLVRSSYHAGEQLESLRRKGHGDGVATS
ncbi:MAG: lipoyl synthase [Thermomicrobiales bacterium]|jgi:lipoic acid synthetase|nr:lipoyl synthase [Thermomicrobiales bacterium]